MQLMHNTYVFFVQTNNEAHVHTQAVFTVTTNGNAPAQRTQTSLSGLAQALWLSGESRASLLIAHCIAGEGMLKSVLRRPATQAALLCSCCVLPTVQLLCGWHSYTIAAQPLIHLQKVNDGIANGTHRTLLSVCQAMCTHPTHPGMDTRSTLGSEGSQVMRCNRSTDDP